MAFSVDTGNITTWNAANCKAVDAYFSHTCGSTVNYLVVGIGIADASPTDGEVSGVTYNGDPMTELNADNHIGVSPVDAFAVYLYGIANPDTGGSYTVSISIGGSVTDISAFAIGIISDNGMELDVAPSSRVVDSLNGPFVTWTTVAADTICFMVGATEQGDPELTVKSGQTQIFLDDWGADFGAACYVIYSSAGSKTVGFDDAAADEDNIGLAISLKETSGAGSVNKDLQAKWDIAELVNKDLQAKWDMFNLVNKDVQAKWDIDVLVNKDLQAVWDMDGLVNKDIQAKWDINNLVNKDLQAKWDIFLMVNKDLQAKWDMAELVYKDLQAVWDMEGVVSKDLQAKWDIAELVYKDIQAVWDLCNTVNKDLQAKWDLLNLVNKDLQAKWDMAELVYKDIQAVWDLCNTVNKDLQAKWDIFLTVNKDLQAKWDISELVNKDIQAVWDILASAGIVNKDIQAVWDIQGEPVGKIYDSDEFFFFFT